MIQIQVTEKELAMIRDALFTTSSAYERDRQQFMREAAANYYALAMRLSKLEEKEPAPD